MFMDNKTYNNETAKFSRRDFLVAGGTAVVAPAIITATTSSADVVAQNADVNTAGSQGNPASDGKKEILLGLVGETNVNRPEPETAFVKVQQLLDKADVLNIMEARKPAIVEKNGVKLGLQYGQFCL